MKVTVFGIGYVGLVQGAVLAEVGHDVLCVDIDAHKVERLNEGFIPIYEPGLEALVRENHAAGRLAFTTDAVAIVEKHNVDGKLPFIELWADSRLETQLSQRPDLIASYGLRS